MRFVGELTSVVRDPEGRIVEGAPNELKQQKDVWTFSRDMASDNPNWLLDRHRRLIPPRAATHHGRPPAPRPHAGGPQLWEQVTASATPLHAPGEPAAAGPGRPPSTARRRRSPRPARHAVRAPEPPRTSLDLAPDPHEALDRAHPHMDRRRFDKLRRGRLDPEARIDLHGMTSERAHAALTGFILHAHARGLRLVLVITGKGRADEHALHRTATASCATACRTGWRPRR